MNVPAIAQQRGIDEATWSALNNSVFAGASAESIVMAVEYCRARKLDVLKKPCHIVPMKVKDQWRDVIMPSIYEQRTTAFRTGEMAGQDEPVFGENIEHLGVTAPEWCRVTVYRLVGGQRYAFSHTEYFVEACATAKKDGKEFINSMWRKRPRGQLAKCAEAGALRKAFPDELGGIIAAEEVQESPSSAEAHPVAQAPQPAQEAVRMIDNEQLEQIRILLSQTQMSETIVLERYQCHELESLTHRQAEGAISKLRKTLEQQQQVIVDGEEIPV